MKIVAPILVIGILAGCGRTGLDSLGGDLADESAENAPGSATGWLAFQARQDEDWKNELRAVDVSGQAPTRILNGEPYFLEHRDMGERLEWAPDGSALLYQAPQGISGTMRPKLYLVDFLSGEDRAAVQVDTADADPKNSFWAPHWAADSQSIGFEVGDTAYLGSKTYWAKVTNQVPELPRLVLDGTQGSRKRWSPDGYKVVYERGVPYTGVYDDELMYVDLTSGEPTQPARLYPAFPTFGDIYWWEWSPDGSWMAYSRPSEEEPCGLYAVRFVAGKIAPPLPLGPGLKKCSKGFYWAPDPQRIAFFAAASTGIDWDLRFVNLGDASAPTTVVGQAIPAGSSIAHLVWLNADRLIYAVADFQREYRLIDLRMQPVAVRVLAVPSPWNGTFLDCGLSSIGYLHRVCVSHCEADDPEWVHELHWLDLMTDVPTRGLGLYTSEYDDIAFSADRTKVVIEARTTREDKGIRGLYLLDLSQCLPSQPLQLDERKHVAITWSPYSGLVWSPNGQAIAFTGDDVTLFWIDITAMPPSKPHALTGAGETIAGYAWRPDR